MTDGNGNFFTPAQSGLTPTCEQLFTPADGAKRCQCHANTIKRIADDLQVIPHRTANGLRLFTLQQIEKIAAELTRRRMEALR